MKKENDSESGEISQEDFVKCTQSLNIDKIYTACALNQHRLIKVSEVMLQSMCQTFHNV
jgi:hypothetical protein